MALLFLFTTSATAQKSSSKDKKSKIKAYNKVITKKAITKKGLFKTHLLDGKLFYEIPKSQLSKELLWVYQISKTQASYRYGGYPLGDRIVRWERRENKVLLRNVEYTKKAAEGSASAIGISYSSIEAIIMSFDIKAFAKNGDPVIDVSSLYLNDTPEFSPKIPLKLKKVDSKRSFFESVKTFPKNIETRVLATFKVDPRDWSKPAKKGVRIPKRSDSSLGSVTLEIHHSMIELPKNKMRPRESDKRIGYFTGSYENYDDNEVQVKDFKFIKRWRLEKKNPNAALSEPVKPIVYYVGRGVPERGTTRVIDSVAQLVRAHDS